MVFATIDNPVALDKFQALLGVEITEEVDRLAECEVGVLFARSPAFGLGTGDVKKYLDLLYEAGVPCVLVLNRNDGALMDYAAQRGVARENMVVPVNRRVPAGRVAALVEPFLQSYELCFDPGESSGHDHRGVEEVPDIALPKRNCLLYGVKGGVGVSTVAAMVASGVDDGFHLEVTGRGRGPTGYCYHGPAPGETGAGYGTWDGSGSFPAPADRTLVIDLNQNAEIGIADELINQTKCFVLVADRSEVSLARVGHLVDHGLRPDILVVCGTLLGSGSGCPVEVFRGEYGGRLGAAVEMPGGPETERVILGAQRRGVPPSACPGGEDLKTAGGELVSLIRTYIG